MNNITSVEGGSVMLIHSTLQNLLIMVQHLVPTYRIKLCIAGICLHLSCSLSKFLCPIKVYDKSQSSCTALISSFWLHGFRGAHAFILLWNPSSHEIKFFLQFSFFSKMGLTDNDYFSSASHHKYTLHDLYLACHSQDLDQDLQRVGFTHNLIANLLIILLGSIIIFVWMAGIAFILV